MITIPGVDPNMIANNLTCGRAVHPGEVVKDELEFRGISQRVFAKEIGVSPTLLNEVLNGKRAVTTEYSLLIEAALGIEADMLMRMQTVYNKQVAQSNPDFLERLKKISKAAVFL